MRRQGFTWVEALVVLLILFILAAILYPVFNRPHGERRPTCLSHLKQIALASVQYSQDAGEAYPPVAAKGSAYYGWADLLSPYLKRIPGYSSVQVLEVFQCPTQGSTPGGQVTPQTSGYTDYWFNARLSSAKLDMVPEASSTILAGEGNDGTDRTDARYNLRQLPPAWLKQEGSPAQRHLDGANYAFADGHVKWLAAVRAPGTKPPGSGGYSFLPK